MRYLIRLTDAAERYEAVLTIDETAVNRPAIEVVFDLIGTDRPHQLVERGVLSADQLDDLQALQALIFDRDEQGLFIRDGIGFTANGRDLDPDAPVERAFEQAELNGQRYDRCHLVVTGVPASAQASGAGSPADPVPPLARALFLHEVAVGNSLDVTRDYADLADLIAALEAENLIAIDTKKAVYMLTPQGVSVHQQLLDEAKRLVQRFDIYGDVALDSSGTARFDTGRGEDLRVPAYELAGVDPFRARFLVGLNDGEWNALSNWHELAMDRRWYERVFEPIEHAPGLDEIGRARMQRVVDQAQGELRGEGDRSW